MLAVTPRVLIRAGVAGVSEGLDNICEVSVERMKHIFACLVVLSVEI